MDWTPWGELSPAFAIKADVLRELLDGGQAFRWDQHEDVWTGIWDSWLVRLRLNAKNRLEWSGPAEIGTETACALKTYLAIGEDWERAVDGLPWRSDPALARLLDSWRGLRILQQPLEETLLTFLCSSTKQIPQIKQICNDLAQVFGDELYPGWHKLPRWEQIHAADEDALRDCRLGYRARYLKGTAAHLNTHPGWLDDLESLPYLEARERLIALPGVGGKIADCVLLFGAKRLEAFPVDTWILKAMSRRYELTGWHPEQIAHFGRVHFGPYAGLAQQFLFSGERSA